MAEAHPTYRETLCCWLKFGFLSFGGPTGQIAIMQVFASGALGLAWWWVQI